LIDARDANELSEHVECEYRVRVEARAYCQSVTVPLPLAPWAAQADKTASDALGHERKHRQREHVLQKKNNFFFLVQSIRFLIVNLFIFHKREKKVEDERGFHYY